VRLGLPALLSLLLARVLEDQRNEQYDPKRSLCVVSVFQAAAFNDVTAYCDVWPIKCRQESKTNKSNCQFRKKSTCDWLVDNSNQDLFGEKPQYTMRLMSSEVSPVRFYGPIDCRTLLPSARFACLQIEEIRPHLPRDGCFPEKPVAIHLNISNRRSQPVPLKN
jgi:hypothetical protein